MTQRIVAALILTFFCSALSRATPMTYEGILSGAAESPPNASPGTGEATVTYDDVLHTLFVDFSFSGLLAGTTAAHIHCCTAAPATGTAGVASPTPFFPGFPIGVTAGTYTGLFDLTLASSWNASFISGNGGTPGSAEAALASGLAGGNAYLNIHTSAFPGGEIRGFLTQPAPEPTTTLLLGIGFGLLMQRKRRSSIRRAS